MPTSLLIEVYNAKLRHVRMEDSRTCARTTSNAENRQWLYKYYDVRSSNHLHKAEEMDYVVDWRHVDYIKAVYYTSPSMARENGVAVCVVRIYADNGIVVDDWNADYVCLVGEVNVPLNVVYASEDGLMLLEEYYQDILNDLRSRNEIVENDE